MVLPSRKELIANAIDGPHRARAPRRVSTFRPAAYAILITLGAALAATFL